LITSEGEALGTLCVIDSVPRELTLEQQDALQILSRHVMAQLELRRRLTDFTRGDLISALAN
jgi:GAF domain-containing protein